MGGWTRGLIVLFREEEGQALAEYSLILTFALSCALSPWAFWGRLWPASSAGDKRLSLADAGP